MVIRRAMCEDCGALESVQVEKAAMRPEASRLVPCAYCASATFHILLLEDGDPEHGKLESRLQAQYDEHRLGIAERLREVEALGADVREFDEDESVRCVLSLTRYLDDDTYLVKHRLQGEAYENAIDMLDKVADRLRNPDKGHVWFVQWEGEDEVPAVNVAWMRGKEVDD